jgi:hypothetical protein
MILQHDLAQSQHRQMSGEQRVAEATVTSSKSSQLISPGGQQLVAVLTQLYAFDGEVVVPCMHACIVKQLDLIVK